MYTVLIIDDEELIRRSLRSKLEKSTLAIDGILEASTIESGIELIRRNRPDIVLCDIRIGNRFGFEIISFIQEESLSIEVVIISGYGEFEYAKRALELHVTEYLLKPIDSPQLVTTLQRCIESIIGKKRQIQDARLSTIEKDSRLNRQCFGIEKEESSVSSQLKPDPSHHLYTSIVINLLQSDERYLLPDIADTLDNTKVWRRQHNVFLMKLTDTEFQILFKFNRREETALSFYFDQYYTSLFSALTEGSTRDLMLGVSNTSTTADQALKEAITAMKHRIIHPSAKIITYNSLTSLDDGIQISKYDTHKLQHYFEQGDLEHVSTCLRDIRQQLSQNSTISYFDVVNTYYMIMNIIRESLLTSKRSMFPKDQLYQFRDLDAIFFYIISIYTDIIIERNLVTGNDHRLKRVSQFKTFIDQNYQDDISLVEYCTENQINVSYLSKEFRKLTGVTYQDYLADLRITKAKSQLVSTNEKISDISNTCGFVNQHYFSRVFRKITGTSPSEYRRKNRTP